MSYTFKWEIVYYLHVFSSKFDVKIFRKKMSVNNKILTQPINDNLYILTGHGILFMYS